jgi:hypothetical protein
VVQSNPIWARLANGTSLPPSFLFPKHTVVLLGLARSMRTPWTSPAMKVVAFSSVGGGWHEVRLSYRKTRHLVPTRSRGDIIAGENRADLAGDGDVIHRYLDEGIAAQRLSTHSCYSGGNPRIWSSR